MNKFKQIQTSPSYCLERGKELLFDDEDIVGSFDYLFRALNLAKKDSRIYADACYNIALAYAEIGLYDESNKYYYQLMASGSDDTGLLGLLDNCRSLGDTKGVERILDFGIKNEIMSSDLKYIYSQVEKQKRPEFRLVSKDENADVKKLVNHLLSYDLVDMAEELLDTTLSGETKDKGILVSQMLVSLARGDSGKTIELAEKILKLDSTNIDALSGLAMTHFRLDNYKKVNVILDELDSLECAEWGDCAKITITACEVESNIMAYKYSKKCLDMDSVDRDFLLINALACANLGYFTHAKRIMAELCTVYPDDVAVHYYARVIHSAKNIPTDLKLEPALPEAVCERMEQYIGSFMGLSSTKFYKEMQTNVRLEEAVKWALNLGDKGIVVAVCDKLSKVKGAYPLICNVLTGEFTVATKKQVLLSLLTNSKENNFFVTTVDNMLMLSRPETAKLFLDKNAILSVNKVFVNMCFEPNPLDDEVERAFIGSVSALSSSGIKIDSNTLTAFVMYMVSADNVYSDIEYVCSQFGCDVKDFKMYYNIITGKELD